MRATVSFVLPFEIPVPAGEPLEPWETSDSEGRVIVFPPCQGTKIPELGTRHFRVDDESMLLKYKPSPEQVPEEGYIVNDMPAVLANLVRVEVCAVSCMRRKDDEKSAQEMAAIVSRALRVLEDLLMRLRLLFRLEFARLPRPDQLSWLLHFSNDDGSELPYDPALIRRQSHDPLIGMPRLFALDSSAWDTIRELKPNQKQPVWDSLLLDAFYLLPEVGPSLVTANAALETFIAWCLDELAAQSQLPAGMWDFVTDRGDWKKEPSVEESFGVLLKVLSGKSMKEDVQLWQAFKELRMARNKFSHEGIPLVAGKPVDVTTAARMIMNAETILRWVEDLLPPSQRRPRVNRMWTATRVLRVPG